MTTRPLFKPRRHNPHVRPVRVHPYYIWGVLYRLQQWEAIKGQEHQFYTPRDIAALLFSNWNELSRHQQDMAVVTKVEPSLLFMRLKSWIREDYEIVYPPKDQLWRATEHRIVNKGTYRVQGVGTFHYAGNKPERVLDMTWWSMDEDWGKWNGRRGLPAKYRNLVDAA